ncbi:MAG: Ig-like domain-containing protein [Synergistaceae bacterium]|nr:Ig-like domain-containing protein [Synergistaceae bacterium]
MLEEKTESYDNSLNKGTPPPPISCNKVYPALLSLLLLISLFAFAAPARAANGTYLIATSGDLIAFRDGINNGTIPASSDAKLTADIDLGGANWRPIADGDLRYAGKFDGGGHTVSGYKITSNDLTYSYSTYYAGFFGQTAASGDVRNLTVSGDINVGGEGSHLYAGGVAGINRGVISDCENRGAVRASVRDNNAGGVAGQNQGTIANCLNGGAVTASDGSIQNYAGGVAGINLSAITNCANVGAVTASGSSQSANIAGGVAGENYGAITNCANGEAVSGDVSRTGGVAGYNGSNGAITNCGWLNSTASADVGRNSGSNPTNVVLLDRTQMNQVVTTVLPASRDIRLSVGGTKLPFTSYPGTLADMSDDFSVTSTSISPDIASIDNSWPYRLTGISEGRATLTASAAIKATDFSTLHSASPAPVSGDTAVSLNCAVTVSAVAVTGVTLDHATLTLANAGATAQLTATVLPAGATNRNVSWSSDNSAVATVDANGLVTAVTAGTATITVTTVDGNYTASCAVTVNGTPTPTPTPSGGSSGGCAAGIGAMALLALLPLVLRRRKR